MICYEIYSPPPAGVDLFDYMAACEWCGELTGTWRHRAFVSGGAIGEVLCHACDVRWHYIAELGRVKAMLHNSDQVKEIYALFVPVNVTYEDVVECGLEYIEQRVAETRGIEGEDYKLTDREIAQAILDHAMFQTYVEEAA